MFPAELKVFKKQLLTDIHYVFLKQNKNAQTESRKCMYEMFLSFRQAFMLNWSCFKLLLALSATVNSFKYLF